MEFSSGIGTGTERQSDSLVILSFICLLYVHVCVLCVYEYRCTLLCLSTHMGRPEGHTGVFLSCFSPDYPEIRSHTELESTVSTTLVDWGPCF